MPATRDDMRELRDDRALLNENGELRHQNEFMRSLGMCVCWGADIPSRLSSKFCPRRILFVCIAFIFIDLYIRSLLLSSHFCPLALCFSLSLSIFLSLSLSLYPSTSALCPAASACHSRAPPRVSQALSGALPRARHCDQRAIDSGMHRVPQRTEFKHKNANSGMIVTNRVFPPTNTTFQSRLPGIFFSSSVSRKM